MKDSWQDTGYISKRLENSPHVSHQKGISLEKIGNQINFQEVKLITGRCIKIDTKFNNYGITWGYHFSSQYITMQKCRIWETGKTYL